VHIADELAPVTFGYVLAGQELHSAAPAPEYVPAGQEVHAVAPASAENCTERNVMIQREIEHANAENMDLV